MKITNPATGEVFREVLEDDRKTIEEKLVRLKAGQRDWQRTPLTDRIASIRNFYELLKKNIDELASDLTSEVGKPLQESKNEINGALYRIEFFLNNSEECLQEKVMHEGGGTRELLAFEPLGTIANISAWNYPYLVGVNVFIPALIAGNAVLYKPSEYATVTGLNIERLLHEAGIPENVFAAVIGDGKVGKILLDLPLQGYFFTGSYETGRKIAKAVAGKLVPVGLELGGKDPAYVTDDVKSVEDAAASLVEGSFYNNGQSCCGVERIYVHEEIYDDFVTKFVEHTQKLNVGDPLLADTNQGAITRPQHIKILEKQVEDAVSKGASLKTGGKKLPIEGSFFAPTVLTDVNHDMLVMWEETFGPVIGIHKVKDDAEALKLMQDTEYGLTAGVFSGSEERAKKILSEINTGNTYWNCSDRVSPHLPWAGRKNSGMGATLSYLGILAFVNPKGYHLRA